MVRISPENHQVKPKSSRLKNVGKWIVALVGYPSIFIHLPFSCCFKNPVSKVMFDQKVLEDPDLNKPMLNLMVGLRSIQLWICCAGCCCGYGGKISPVEFP